MRGANQHGALLAYDRLANILDINFAGKIPADVDKALTLLRTEVEAVVGMKKAREAHGESAKQKRDQQVFVLNWTGGGPVDYVTGWSTLCAYLNIRESSLRVLLSKGRNLATFQRTSPTTGELDMLKVSRQLSVPAGEPAKRGRPPKPDPIAEWEGERD